MPLDVRLPGSDDPRRDLALAIAPFALIPVVIGAYAIGWRGVAVALLGVGLWWMFLPGFIRGSASQRWGGRLGDSGRIHYRHSTAYRGWVARVATGRYLLVGLVLIVAGVAETVSQGSMTDLFDDGPGWPMAVVGLGLLLAASAVVALTPGKVSADAPTGSAVGGLVASVGKTFQLVIGLGLVVIGAVELATGGAVSQAIRDANPLSGLG